LTGDRRKPLDRPDIGDIAHAAELAVRAKQSLTEPLLDHLVGNGK
jgi:hypothetical protein